MYYLNQILSITYKRRIYKLSRIYPTCGRNHCNCVKDTNLENKKNKEFYIKCYRQWCLSRF